MRLYSCDVSVYYAHDMCGYLVLLLSHVAGVVPIVQRPNVVHHRKEGVTAERESYRIKMPCLRSRARRRKIRADGVYKEGCQHGTVKGVSDRK